MFEFPNIIGSAFLVDTFAHARDFDDQPRVLARLLHNGADDLRHMFAKCWTAGNHPGAGQRHMLPRPGGFVMIFGKSLNFRGQW